VIAAQLPRNIPFSSRNSRERFACITNFAFSTHWYSNNRCCGAAISFFGFRAAIGSFGFRAPIAAPGGQVKLLRS
jgi:hypothetical protein